MDARIIRAGLEPHENLRRKVEPMIKTRLNQTARLRQQPSYSSAQNCFSRHVLDIGATRNPNRTEGAY